MDNGSISKTLKDEFETLLKKGPFSLKFYLNQYEQNISPIQPTHIFEIFEFINKLISAIQTLESEIDELSSDVKKQ